MENENTAPAAKPKKGFLEDRYDLLAAAVIIFAFVVRLYYFFLTKNQAFWFDETEYLGIAKHWAFNTYALMNAQRLPVMPFFAAIIYKLGGTTGAVKFLTSLLPSVGTVAMFYFLGTKMYDKKTGLLASAMMSVFWVSLFWTNRINTDMLAFLFTLLALYFTWTGFVLKENEKHIRYALPFFVLAFLTKPNMALVALVAAAFLLFLHRFEIFKKKELWQSVVLTLPIAVPFLIWEKIQYGSFLAFRGATHVLAKSTALQVSYKPVAWYVFSFIYTFPEKVLFFISLLGLGIFIIYLALGKDLIKKDSRLGANLFLLVLFIVSLAYFVFVERDAEDRWIMPIVITIFFAAANGLVKIQGWIGKYNRHAAIAAIVLLLAAGSYFQLAHADSITKIKIGTYSQEPLAGAWLKEHTLPGDTLVSNNEHVPFVFYSERQVDGVSIFESPEKLKNLGPKYYVVTAYYPSPQWTYELPQKYPQALVPVQAFFENRNGQQIPVIAIYEFKNYDLALAQ